MNDIAIILNLECNKFISRIYDGIQHTHEMRYEDEIMRFVKYFRQNTGKYKDCHIYCLAFKDRPVQQNTIDFLIKNNVIIITANCKYPKLKTPHMIEVFLGKYFETPGLIPENILVKIDIDTIMLRPFDDDLFQGLDNVVKIGQYNEYSTMSSRLTFTKNEFPFDNSFIISNKKTKFYSIYYNLCNSDELWNLNIFKQISKQHGDCFIVEFAIDYIRFNKLFNIEPIRDYQIGEGYDDLGIIPDERLKHVYFIHSHIYPNQKNSFAKYYIKILKLITLKNKYNF